ncbi:MAG: hypothetical protein Kow00114_33600 [Kiloniellaceae bacterium]
MSVFDASGAAELRPDGRWPQDGGASLDIDEILSRGGDDLGLEVDGDGYLTLIEGSDFE